MLTAYPFLNQILAIDTRKKCILGVVIFLPALVLAGYFVLLPAYRQVKEDRAASQAVSFFSAGDLQSAWVAARRALSINPSNAPALDTIAKMAEKSRSRAAMEWRKRLADAHPTLENKFSLVSASLRCETSPFPTASELLEELKSAATNAQFHVLSAELAVQKKDINLAERHLDEAMRLDPTNLLSRLNLLAIRLQSTNSAVRDAAREGLFLLRTNSQTAANATRWLIRDSFQRKDLASAADLSTALAAREDATFEDRLQNLSVLKDLASPEFAAAFEALKLRSATNAASVYALNAWMLEALLGPESDQWWHSLSLSVRTNMPAPLARVDYLALQKDWHGLEEFLGGVGWGDSEFLRQALLAKVADELGEESIAEMRWKAACRAAGDNEAAVRKLLDLAGKWDLRREQEDLLWAMVKRSPRERWAFLELDRLYTTSGNTRGLHALYGAMLKLDSTNVVLRNNVAATALLLGEDVALAHQAAKELYNETPGNPTVASTYAFSLYRQNQLQEAAAVLAKLDPVFLDQPAIALYHGVVLHAIGETNRAARFISIASAASLLPEERSLIPSN